MNALKKEILKISIFYLSQGFQRYQYFLILMNEHIVQGQPIYWRNQLHYRTMTQL